MTIAALRTTPSGSAASSGELRGLTGLRIVAAVWVVLFHFHFTALPGVAEVIGVLGPLITSGALGVDLFFVLSGFVIAYTYLDQLGPALRVRSTGRFLWARLSRMWPVYALVFHAFGLWLVARSVFGSDDQIAFQSVQPVLSTGEWLQQLFLVQLWGDPYFDGASWAGAHWSISAEMLAYLLFPVVALVFFRLRNLPPVVLGGAALALMVPMVLAYAEAGNPYYAWSWLVRILCGFGAGVLVYLVVRRLQREGRGATGTVRRGASVLATAVPVLIVAGLSFGELLGAGRGGVVIALFPVLIGAVALADRGPVARLLSTRPAVYGGRISYSLYLVHIPLFEVYWLAMAYVPALVAPTALAHAAGAAVLLVTFAVAAAAYHWVEEPARRRMRLAAVPGERPAVVVPAARVPADAAPAAPAAAPRRPARSEPHPPPSQRRHVDGGGPRHLERAACVRANRLQLGS